jgi:hypothetical protein
MCPTSTEPTLPQRTLLLSVDWEDWHQLVRRRAGDPRWQRPGPALARQTEAALELLGELGVRCTFFVVGMAARAHPELLEAIRSQGHEIASHGDQHLPVATQTPETFAEDLRASIETLGELCGVRPAGYRAPAFSIGRGQAWWAHTALLRAGFAYDASQSDTLVVRDRIVSQSHLPHRLAGGLWEFPVASRALWGLRVPLGGASYWSLMTTEAVVRGLREAGPCGGLYLHPHELDPRPLSPSLGPSVAPGARARTWARTGRRELARRRAGHVLREIAANFTLIPYGEAHARLSDGTAGS